VSLLEAPRRVFEHPARPASEHDVGLLDVRLARSPRGHSALIGCRQRFPLRTTMPFYLDRRAPDMAFIYVQNPTGGVFAGDDLRTRVEADHGVRVHLTTQSATKLYRSDGRDACQELRFDLHAGAYVENLPDPLIPHAGARYRQHTHVELAEGAIFLTAETIAPGRRARGERFAYDLVELTTDVRRGDREICAERLRLEPPRAGLDRSGVLGGADYLVSVLVLAPESDSGSLAAAIDDVLCQDRDVHGAAGELPRGCGAVARVLARDATSARRSLSRIWAAVRLELFDLPLPETRK
jgi:urease accessory protein